MGIIEKKLFNLESNCLFHASKALEYSIDWNMETDDYSREFILYEFIYSFEVFKRALDNNKNHQTYKYLEYVINDLLSKLKNVNFKSKSQEFLKQYYSEKRYTALLENLKTHTNLETNLDDDITDIQDTALDYFLIYDKINLICNNQMLNIHYQDIQSTLIDYKNILTKVFYNYSSLWSYYSEEIKMESLALLIPAKNEHAYWKEFITISSKEISEVFSRYLKTQTQNSALLDLLKKLTPKTLSHLNLPKVIHSLREVIGFNDFLDELFLDEKVQPAFATYTNTKDDNDLNINNIVDVLINQKNSIDQMIDSIEKMVISNNEKRELIIALYILFDEKDKAIALSK